MKNNFTIQEISELLGLPKSTLRYWDSEGLITPSRNSNNKYREYSLNSLYELSEIMLYRDLHMSNKELKSLYHITPGQLMEVLTENEKKVDQEIKKLQESKKAIIKKKQRFATYKQILDNPYQYSTPDTTRLYEMDLTNKDYWQNCYSDSYHFALFIDSNTNETKHACILPEFGCSTTPIWEFHDSTFVSCILRYDFADYKINDVETHVNHLHSLGYKTGDIIARHLFSASDSTRNDYFIGWIEVFQ